MTTSEWGPWIGIDPETNRRTHWATPQWYRAGDAERAVVFQPGYRTSRTTFGKHGLEITWYFRGPRGVTQFVVSTGWVPGEKGVQPSVADLYPMAADVGYHALCPQWEGQERYGRDDCTLMLAGQKCYYDGSGLQAEDLMARFLIEGESAVWQELSERHDALLIPGGVNA